MDKTKMITRETPGLLPLPDDLTGRTLVLAPDKLGARFQLPKFQIVRATGGFGCKPQSLGTKVYVEFVCDGDEATYTSGAFIGEASPEMIENAKTDDTPEAPVDLNDMSYMAIGDGRWVKAPTEKEAKAKLKALRCKCAAVYYTHSETGFDGMFLTWPKGAKPAELVWERKKS